jgi:acetyl esterase/lipase
MTTTSACYALLFSFLTSAAVAQPPATAPEREYPSTKLVLERNIEYARADGKALLLDLYRPRQLSNAVPLPVLVWIHGEEGRFAGRYPCPIASMIGNGYAVASIDYRSDKDGKFPAQIEDCQAAVRWLRANASKYDLDAGHVGAWGWSGGGRLAVMLGVTGANVDPASMVQAVVDFCGPVSTPILSVPMMILHGANDKVTPPEQSKAMDVALRGRGVKSTLEVVQGAGHDFKELRQGEQVELVNNFLDEQLKGGAHVRFRLLKIDVPDDAWVDPIIDEPMGTKYMTFPAASLGPNGQASYLIYLPPGYERATGKRYPVLYYLHGGGGSQRVCDIWVQKLDAAIRAGKIPPMISVSVQGLPGGRFLDSPDGKSPIESVIMKDLIPHIDATYRTIPKRESRVLEGLSMGG